MPVPLLDRTYRRRRKAVVEAAVVLLPALIARTVEVRAWESGGATARPAKEKRLCTTITRNPKTGRGTPAPPSPGTPTLPRKAVPQCSTYGA
ncbi:hypothetical protein Stsp02_31510 [Streptomyces sp. NBRC 14336]|nr:hypothetical protein Stsp02_31510 [Streptomyces sp. NBRC 14336]